MPAALPNATNLEGVLASGPPIDDQPHWQWSDKMRASARVGEMLMILAAGCRLAGRPRIWLGEAMRLDRGQRQDPSSRSGYCKASGQIGSVEGCEVEHPGHIGHRGDVLGV